MRRDPGQFPVVASGRADYPLAAISIRPRLHAQNITDLRWIYGEDYAFVAHVHNEWQLPINNGTHGTVT
jgi:hypothetical protein